MAGLHLVTGYKGSAHITAVDQGLFNAGCVGSGEYVFATGKRFEAQIISNNTVRIYGGSLLMQGRHVNMESDSYLDVTISNGTQSMNRNDLIVLRYTKDSSTGVESVSLEAIQGTAASGTASDPAYTADSIFDGAITHDMPLYRVCLSGLNITSVEPIFNVLAPMSDIHKGYYKQNMLINGDFQCNQRGRTTYDVGSTAAYSVDMWRAYQVAVTVRNDGVKVAGKSTTVQGYFTQFIQLGLLETTTYTISAMVDDKICTFTLTPGGAAKEKDFGTFKITALTTSTWDDTLPEFNNYNNKLKINICPKGTNEIYIKYIDVFEGDVAYPHVKEDPATALMRCRRYIQHGAISTPTLYMYTSDSKYAYRFAITYDRMVNLPSLETCSWSYYNVTGESTSGSVSEVTVVGNVSEIMQLRSAYKEEKSAQCHSIRLVYLLTCEPTDP